MFFFLLSHFVAVLTSLFNANIFGGANDFFSAKTFFIRLYGSSWRFFFEGWNFLFLLLFHSFTTDASAHSGKSICRFEISSFGNAWALNGNGWTEDWRTFLIWLRDYIEKFDLATLSSPRWCWDNCLFFWQCWSANLFCEMQKKLSRNFFFNTFLFADETSQNVCS